MSAVFDRASSMELVNAAPTITAAPFTVAMWVWPALINTAQTIWSLCDTASANKRFTIAQNGTTSWTFTSQGTTARTISLGTIVASTWNFLLAREISSTNRRFCVLNAGGATAHGVDTNSSTPTSIDTMALGCNHDSSPDTFWSGRIAEFWYTNTDIQADGGQLQDSTLRQLAFGGPFSVPHIAKDIIEYRGFRQVLTSNQDRPDEVYLGAGKTRQTWTNTNGVTHGPHVPLPGIYRKPRTADTILMGIV